MRSETKSPTFQTRLRFSPKKNRTRVVQIFEASFASLHRRQHQQQLQQQHQQQQQLQQQQQRHFFADFEKTKKIPDSDVSRLLDFVAMSAFEVEQKADFIGSEILNDPTSERLK